MNLKDKLKKVFKSKKFLTLLIILVSIVLFYVISTFFAFKTAIDYATQNTEYKEARAYMVSALMVNEKYIYPLTFVFGWDRVIIKPFYFIRDKLFDIGYSKFPKNEGEKELWWYTVKFQEYEEWESPALQDYAINVKPSRYLQSKRRIYINQLDDLYIHLVIFAQANITNKTDKLLAKQKLVEFVIMARRYQDSNTILKHKFDRDSQAKLGIKGVDPVLPPEDIKRYEHIYDIYVNLLNYSKAHEKESYKYFYSDPVHWLGGNIISYELAEDIVNSKMYTNKLDSNDRFIKIFVCEYAKIRDFYYKNKENKTINPSLLIDAHNIVMNVNLFLAYKFQNEPFMKNYVNYCVIEENNLFRTNHKTINEILNIKELTKSLIKHQNYDRVKQLKSIGIK